MVRKMMQSHDATYPYARPLIGTAGTEPWYHDALVGLTGDSSGLPGSVLDSVLDSVLGLGFRFRSGLWFGLWFGFGAPSAIRKERLGKRPAKSNLEGAHLISTVHGTDIVEHCVTAR